MTDKKNLLLLVLISFLIFVSKWIASYHLFTESVSTKIIFESVSDGYYYFPLVKYLSIFDFNNSFNPNFESLDNIMMPFYSIFIHAFFYKLIGSFAFIIAEFFSIFLFLLILYKIFNHYYSKEVSILFTMIIFIIPIILTIFPIGDFSYFKLITNNIYNLRFPRPLITTLYLFIFLYFFISIEKIELFSKKNFFLLGIIMAVTLSSFYYYFFLQASMLIFYIIYKNKYSFLNKILTNWDSLIIFFLVFTIISLPLLININFHEEDYTRRLGLININIDQKIILLKHYLMSYLQIEFLAFLLVFFIILDFFNAFSVKYLNKMVINFTSTILVVICIFFNFYKTTLVDKQNSIDERLEFNIISNIILNNYDLSKSTLMTFDNRFMVWSVLNNIQFLNLTNFIMTPKKDTTIENDLIKAFKFLDLDANDFNLFIQNKKTSWRYINYDLSTFLFYKYMANPIKTFNDSKDFNPGVYDYIKGSSPINFEQTIIPNAELDRLNNKFLLVNLKKFNYPDIVIINKNNRFLKKIKIINNYCKIFEKKFFILLLKKDHKKQC